MDTVINSNGTLIVAGRTGTPNDPDLVIWESTDGFTWRQGPIGLLPQPIRPLNAVAHNNKLIIVGITNAITQTTASEGAVWVETSHYLEVWLRDRELKRHSLRGEVLTGVLRHNRRAQGLDNRR